MKLEATELQGVFWIDLNPFRDERGWFVRTFEEEFFAGLGLQTRFPHHNVVLNSEANVLRGLHYQVPPRGEVKVIHRLQGSVYDVLVDLRPSSPTYRSWQSFVLDRSDRLLYVPVGFAHGYQVLESPAMLAYLMGDEYSPAHERGIRWDEPTLGIDWPAPPTLSAKDAAYPDVDWDEAWPTS